MHRFSVISPVYNTSEYLRDFLDSVLSQSFTDFELILVDDGSTDNSLDICREYAGRDNRIVVLTQHNQGAGAARNRGIEAATSELIIFLDSDDHISPNAFEVLNRTVSERDCDLYLYGLEEVVYSEKDDVIGRTPFCMERTQLYSAEDCRELFCTLIFGSLLNIPWNKVYRKQLIDRFHVRFPDTRRMQDAFFNMELFRHISSLYIIPDVLYHYRANNNARVWKKFPKDTYKIDIQYNSTLVSVCQEFGVYSGNDRKMVDRWFYSTILRDAGYYRNPNWRLSRKEKKEYVMTVISADYNQQRAQNTPASDKRSVQIRKRMLNRDASGLMRDIKRFAAWDKYYALYCRTVRKAVRGN